ncbi:MAG: hypothetical protein CVV47_13625 [Spirochaetae bacterium HGW-Spirochaetae-3]|jgi:hypothetical protein|nr:MAG: hypothetical protein CVV47_13625 [Spirochaetae bacterium HGW-Spirochaetae-3]
MKKSVLVLGILVMAIGVASAQEIEPVRIELGLPAKFPGLTAEWAFPMGNMSLGAGVGVIPLVILYGGEVVVRFYPFSPEGDGLFISGAYSQVYRDVAKDGEWDIEHGASICAGYRIILWKHFTIRGGLGYMFNYMPSEPTPISHQVGMEMGIGIAF